MRNMIRHKVAGALLVAFALTGCDILDVENPNNLGEESIRATSAASAVVNGSEALVYSAISQIWQPYSVVSDELYWIGSRDAYESLDQGNISNEENEFTDAAFPALGEARWMADEAISIIEDHIADGESLGGDADLLLARANLYAGLIYTIIGEVQEDFAFSDKQEAAPPIGPANMSTVFDDAINYLSAAVTAAEAAGGEDGEAVEFQAMMMRARARHSKAIWGKVNPSVASDPLVADAAAAADALSAITMAGGVTADEAYQATFSSATILNVMADWVNDRKENNIDPLYATSASNADITGIALQDPVDNVDDPAVTARVNEFRINGERYVPLNLATTRMMHLILAENALAGGDTGGFQTHINHVRAMDDLTDWTPASGVTAEAMLQHARRANLMLMGLRLNDMYRFGVDHSRWQPGSVAATSPGTLLPITIVEIRANCYLNGTCSG